jgi:hypothetical protein
MASANAERRLMKANGIPHQFKLPFDRVERLRALGQDARMPA